MRSIPWVAAGAAVLLSLATPPAAGAAVRLAALDRAQTRPFISEARWAAYGLPSKRTRLIDTWRARTRTFRNPQGCFGPAGMGERLILYVCDRKRLIVFDARARRIAPAPGLRMLEGWLASCQYCSVGVSAFGSHGLGFSVRDPELGTDNDYLMNWRTGQTMAPYPQLDEVHDLDVPGLRRKLCAPVRRSEQPSNPWGLETSYIHPWVYTVGTSTRLPVIHRCGGATTTLPRGLYTSALPYKMALRRVSADQRLTIEVFPVPTGRRTRVPVGRIEALPAVQLTRRMVFVTYYHVGQRYDIFAARLPR
jgi:hypothetical protein